MQQQNRKENDPGRQEKKIYTMSSKRPKEMPNLKKTTIQTEYKEAKWGDFY